jgi:hypothetical protein
LLSGSVVFFFFYNKNFSLEKWRNGSRKQIGWIDWDFRKLRFWQYVYQFS